MMENITKENLQSYYLNHSALEAARYFNVSKHIIYKLLKEYEIKKHSMSKSVSLSLNGKENAFKKSLNIKFNNLIANIDKQQLIEYYKTHNNEDTALYFKIEYNFKKVLDYFEIPHHTSKETKEINYINLYGSIEAGMKIENQKRLSSMNYEENFKKIKATNLIKYGGDSPFSSEEILNNKNATVKEKYNVDNVFLIPNLVSNAVFKKYGVTSTAQLDWVRAKLVKSAKRCIASDGTHFDSSWEVKVYEYCLKNNIHIERNIPINYNYNNKNHITFIDFKFNDKLYEVKGNHLLNGCFDDLLEIPISVKLDVYKNNNITIITNLLDVDQSKYNSINFIDITEFT